MALVVSLYIGDIRPLPPEYQPTGMFKTQCREPLWLGREGLAGDQQADRRVHGGPERAVHLYPAGHYERLAAAFPATSPLSPGTLGENLSVAGLDETMVRVGDIFQLGQARLQVSQPRSPCWKIDRRLDTQGVAAFIAATGITGWYFRVLEEGQVAPGDILELLERSAAPISLAMLWQLYLTHRPDPAALDAAARTPGLSPDWARKFSERAQWLLEQ